VDDDCTTDYCDNLSGLCHHERLICDDENYCTTDLCNPTLGCRFILCCDDGDPCTEDLCEPSQGCYYNNLCINSTISDNFDHWKKRSEEIPKEVQRDCAFMHCDDENACTYDRCEGGACYFEPIGCDDNNPCTLDNCVPSSGCHHYILSDCDSHTEDDHSGHTLPLFSVGIVVGVVFMAILSVVLWKANK